MFGIQTKFFIYDKSAESEQTVTAVRNMFLFQGCIARENSFLVNKLTQGIILLHDNACLLIANAMEQSCN